MLTGTELFNQLSRMTEQERERHSYLETRHKTKYSVTMSFLIHATIEVDAVDADQATDMAYDAVKNGKITIEDLKEDDQWPETVEVDEVYNTETEQMEKNIFMRGEETHPKQKKDIENKEN